ncbi:MAG: TetR/AcrR family transcriptional regulator [Ilumatobacter sp.]|uniref:TetR/AcrR family transcriptional regulator n=1 Tax=Ilumatobacter sp. TaxID=1967498 RepID=UPI003298B123
MRGAAVVSEPRRRMRSDDRRRQLLDTAARLVVEHGAAALSMERLASEAGVSKALPYRHFENGDEVLVELFRRETGGLGREVWRALRDASPDSDRIGVGVKAYFDGVVDRGDVLAALSRPGSTIASVADPDRAGVVFEVEVLHRFHGVPRDRAKDIAGMIQGALVGAVGTLHAGFGSRDQLEADLVALIRGLVDSPG